MGLLKTRSAAPAAKPAAQAAPKKGWLRRGAAVFEEAHAESERQEERAERRKAGLDNVWRFWLNKDEEAVIVILDNSLDEVVALFEHNIKGADGKFGNFETCPKEFSHCTVCDRFGESYYVMYLTILDTRGYDRKKDGGAVEHVEAVRRLLPIKTREIGSWKSLAEAAMKKYGTLRGITIKLYRDKGQQSSRIGSPQILDDGMAFEWYDEDTLVEQFGHEALIGRDNKTVIKEENADIMPFDYEKLFAPPDADDLRKRYGGQPGAGSADEAEEHLGEEAQNTISGRRKLLARGARTAAPAAASRVAGTRTRTRPTPAPAAEEEAAAGDGEEPFEE